MSIFKKAERKKSKLRMALIGPSGSGKTKSALFLAKGIGGKIAFLDTERGSGSFYCDVVDFDTIDLIAPFSPERYIKIIKEAEKEGYNVLIIDSLSHAWSGEGGLLEMVDAYSTGKSAFTNGWKKCSPEQNKLINAILTANLHIICCIRTKTAYELQTDERGKIKPVKIGLAPVQRENIDYEFTLIFDLENEHHFAIASKNRTTLFKGAPFVITEETGKEIYSWLNEGIVHDSSDMDAIKQSYINSINQSLTEEELIENYKKAISENNNDDLFKDLLINICKERKLKINEISEEQRTLTRYPENYENIRG